MQHEIINDEYMNKTLTLLMALVLGCISAYSVPAKLGVKRTVTLADGSMVELTLRGDEHFSYYTADDGTPYQLKADGQLLKMTPEEVSKRWTELRAKHLASDPRRANARMRSPKEVGIPGQTTGKHRGLVLLVEFKDVKFASQDPNATFKRFFNEEGYNDYGNTGSVRDYFLKQSYGKLEIDFDVYGPYTTGGLMASYGADDGDDVDVNARAMVLEAIDQASKDVDFSNYDWNNDGEVDQVFIICAGFSEAEGADPEYIWPHESRLTVERNYNGKKLNIYGVATELWGDGKRSNLDKEICGIGAACHEFSHCLGLPDFYDTTYSGGFGLHTWSVMDYGGNLNNGHTPAGYTSYERMFAGWLEPTELTEKTSVKDMKPLATTPEAYILYNEGNKNEFYLLENRQPVDFDAKLQGHGMLVLHVDYEEMSWVTNSVNDDVNHQRITIIPADGQLSSSSKSMGGDPFPGTSGNTALTNYTTPASTLYNANSDGGYFMNKSIDNITESEDGLISFVACRPELAAPQPDDGKEIEGDNAFTVSWPAVNGAIGYELELTETGTASSDPNEALEREFTFEKFVSKTVGFSDVSSKMSDYGLSGWTGSKIFTTPNKMRLGTSSAAGNVRTATWKVPQSTEITIVMGADVVKAGTTVNGKLLIAYGNAGESATYEEVDFEVTGNGRHVFHFTVRKGLFWLEIEPSSQMYLNYLAIYDGTWTAEQLGITNAAARELAPRRAATVTTYTTETNSITLSNLNKSSRFVYRVRSLGEENTYSKWSEERTFMFSSTVGTIGDVNNDGKCDAKDIIAISQWIMGKYSGEFNEETADVNGDGKINIADIIAIMQKILR